MERGFTPTKSADVFAFIVSAMTVLSGLAQLFDFYSDILVLIVVYVAGFKSSHQDAILDYQIALFVCFLSLAATFMAT